MSQNFKYLRVLLLLGIALSLLGNLQRFVIPGTTIAWYGHEMVLGVMVLGGMIILRKHWIPAFARMTRGDMGMTGCLILLIVLSFFLPFRNYTLSQNLVAGLYLTRVFFYILVGLVARQILTKEDTKWILPFCLTILSLGFIQLLILPDLRPFTNKGWDDHFGRLFGTYFDPSTAAAMIGATVLLSLEVIRGRWRYIVGVLGGLALILTFSRSGYVALIGSLGGMVFKGGFGKLGKFGLMVLLGGVAIFVFLIPKPQISEGFNLFRTASIHGRLEDSKKAIGVIRKNPLFGVGYNRIRYQREFQNEKSMADASFASSYLTMWATIGLLGTLGVVGIFGQTIRKIKIGRPALIYLLIMGIFDNVLLVNFMMLFIALLMSLGLPRSHPTLQHS